MNSVKNSNRFMFFLMLYEIAASFFLVIVMMVVVLLKSPEMLHSVPSVEEILGSLPVSLGTLNAVQEVIMFILPCVLIALLFRGKIKEIFPFKRIGSVNIMLIIGMCIFIQPFMMLLSSISSTVFSNNVSSTLDVVFDEGNIFYALAVFAVTPAVCEELAMRGVVFSGYKNVSILKAALINGLFFGIMHLSPQQFLYAFALGAVFAVFVRMTGSLSSSMLGHFIINASQVSFFYLIKLIPDIPDGVEPTAVSNIVSNIVYLIIVAVTLTIFAVLFGLFIRHNKKRNESIKATDSLENSEVLELPRPSGNEPVERKQPELLLTPAFWGAIIVYIVGCFLLI